MKRSMKRALALLCALALTAGLPVLALAESAGPGAEDIAAAGAAGIIQIPKDFFAERKTMYVDAPLGHSILVHIQAGAAAGAGQIIVDHISDLLAPVEELLLPCAYHGARVTALAEEGGYTCILYHDDSNTLRAGWVLSDQLSPDYPGRSLGGTLSGEAAAVEPGLKWSKENYPGSKQKYSVLDEPVENCRGFVLDYQLTYRNGAWEGDLFGPRTVYAYDGKDWIEVGSFDYEALGPVQVSVALDKPMSLHAIATVADCARPNVFGFRQSLLEVYAD